MSSPHPAEPGEAPDDPESAITETVLLARLRDGDDAAFGELYRRHVVAVRGFTRRLSIDGAEADDISAETFFRVLRALRRGAGPTENVRAYLLTVARRVCWEWQAARREVPTPDEDLDQGSQSAGGTSTAEQAVIAKAFCRLPQRWRAVLWHTEVEGERPAAVAARFGLSANAAAALARRARHGLRAAYLQEHVTAAQSSWRCRTVRDRLGSYTAGVVTGAQARRVRTHLRWCRHCRATHGQLREVFTALRSHAGALAVLAPAGGAALAGTGGGAGSSVVGTVLAAVGTKLKVGVTSVVATTAGVVAAAPVAVDWHADQTVGMPDHSVQLTLASSSLATGASPREVSTRPAGDIAAATSVSGATDTALPETARAVRTPAVADPSVVHAVPVDETTTGTSATQFAGRSGGHSRWDLSATSEVTSPGTSTPGSGTGSPSGHSSGALPTPTTAPTTEPTTVGTSEPPGESTTGASSVSTLPRGSATSSTATATARSTPTGSGGY